MGRDALDPFILSQYQTTGDGAGSAQSMFHALDASCRLREGLSKSYLKDQLVYYEPYSFHASLLVQRPDGSTMQDFWSAGALLSHTKDEEISLGTAGIQIWYTPLQVHVI